MDRKNFIMRVTLPGCELAISGEAPCLKAIKDKECPRLSGGDCEDCDFDPVTLEYITG